MILGYKTSKEYNYSGLVYTHHLYINNSTSFTQRKIMIKHNVNEQGSRVDPLIELTI